MNVRFRRVTRTPTHAATPVAVPESAVVDVARARWQPIASQVRVLLRQSVVLAVCAAVLAVWVVTVLYMIESGGSASSLIDWWRGVRALRSEMSSAVLLGAPAAIIVPSVVAVTLAPNDPSRRDEPFQANHLAAMEFVRVVLFAALLGTAVLSAIAAIPGSDADHGEIAVGALLLGVCAGMSVLLRPHDVLLELRAAEVEVRQRAYLAAVKHHHEKCRALGWPEWTLKEGGWRGCLVRLAVVVCAGAAVFGLVLVIFVVQAVESGGTSTSKIAELVVVASLTGMMAGIPALLTFQAGGEWRTGERGSRRWLEAAPYVFYNAIVVTLILAFSAGMWVGSSELLQYALSAAVPIVAIGGLLWPLVHKKSRLIALMDQRCLLGRAHLIRLHRSSLGVTTQRDPVGAYGWPFPKTTKNFGATEVESSEAQGTRGLA